MKPVFRQVTIDHHLCKRVKRVDAREAKCLWSPAMGFLINFRQRERTIVLN